MSLERNSSRFLLALMSGAALSACSPSASTAVPPVEATAAAALMPVAAQAVATPPVGAAPVQPLVTGLPDFTRLVEAYGPAVVNVRVEARAQQTRTRQRSPLEGFEGFELPPGFPGFQIPREMDPREQQPSRGEGSGFIVSPDGYIMTNAHVVAEADRVIVRMFDRRELTAKVIGFDERTDVAVIKVEASNLPTVKLGNPSKLKPGQWVVAIGSPFGMQNTVTAGIVSATSRDLPTDRNNPAPPFIQTDAAVNPGNSGGPLFNLDGEVIGINSQIYSQNGGYMGLSFAIPIDIADNVRDQLVKTGRVSRGMLGVSVGSVTAAQAEEFGLDRPRGALVSEVSEGLPAEKAGLRPGDIILAVDDLQLGPDSSLPTIISSKAPGTETVLEIWREGKPRKVTVKLVENTQRAAAARNVPARAERDAPAAETILGMTVRQLTADERRQADTQGNILVEEATGAAADRGLQRGDIIISVRGTDVRTVGELQNLVRGTRAPTVTLRVQSGQTGAVGFVTIPRS